MTEEQGKYQVTDRRFVSQTPDMEFLPAAQDTASMMMVAIQKGYDPAFIREMMDLRDREESRAAKKAYIVAMAEFKANPPEIIKGKKAGFDHRDGQGRTEYSYADLAMVAKACNDGLSAHGLSASWETSQDGDNITVACIMTHAMGHSERTSLTAKSDQSGKKNPIQAIASTISYLEKYTLLAITGLAAQGMDDDGNSSGGEPEYISADQQTVINDRIKEIYTDSGKLFLKWMKVGAVDKIPAALYSKAIDGLNKAEKAKGEADAKKKERP